MCDQSQFNISNIPQSCYYYLNFFKCIFLKILVFTKLLSEQHKVFFFLLLAVDSLHVFVFPENTISLPAPRNTPCMQLATVLHCGNPAVWW